jgi:hypothetical protein
MDRLIPERLPEFASWVPAEVVARDADIARDATPCLV